MHLREGGLMGRDVSGGEGGKDMSGDFGSLLQNVMPVR